MQTAIFYFAAAAWHKYRSRCDYCLAHIPRCQCQDQKAGKVDGDAFMICIFSSGRLLKIWTKLKIWTQLWTQNFSAVKKACPKLRHSQLCMQIFAAPSNNKYFFKIMFCQEIFVPEGCTRFFEMHLNWVISFSILIFGIFRYHSYVLRYISEWNTVAT